MFNFPWVEETLAIQAYLENLNKFLLRSLGPYMFDLDVNIAADDIKQGCHPRKLSIA